MVELLPPNCRRCIHFRDVGDFDSRDVSCEQIDKTTQEEHFNYEDLPGGLFGTLPSEINLQRMAIACPDFTTEKTSLCYNYFMEIGPENPSQEFEFNYLTDDDV